MKRPYSLKSFFFKTALLFFSLLFLFSNQFAESADQEFDYNEIGEKRGGGRAFLGPAYESEIYGGEKRGGARPFIIDESEKRGGGGYQIDEPRKRGGARPFFGTTDFLKRGGGRFFTNYAGNNDWTILKRGGGRAFQKFQQKRAGARAFFGGISGMGMMDRAFVPNYVSRKSEPLLIKEVDSGRNPALRKYFYQSNHNYDGLKRGGVWPWTIIGYGRLAGNPTDN